PGFGTATPRIAGPTRIAAAPRCRAVARLALARSPRTAFAARLALSRRLSAGLVAGHTAGFATRTPLAGAGTTATAACGALLSDHVETAQLAAFVGHGHAAGGPGALRARRRLHFAAAARATLADHRLQRQHAMLVGNADFALDRRHLAFAEFL